MSANLCDMFECLEAPRNEVLTWDFGTLFLCTDHTEDYKQSVLDWLEVKRLP